MFLLIKLSIRTRYGVQIIKLTIEQATQEKPNSVNFTKQAQRWIMVRRLRYTLISNTVGVQNIVLQFVLKMHINEQYLDNYIIRVYPIFKYLWITHIYNFWLSYWMFYAYKAVMERLRCAWLLVRTKEIEEEQNRPEVRWKFY